MAIDIQKVRPSKLLGGEDRYVRGINSSIDDVTLLGRRFRGKVTQAVTEAWLTRSIEVASAVEITVHDPDAELRRSKLLESKYDIELDGLGFRLRGISRSGDALTLTHEDIDVARARRVKGPAKAFRDQMTRAEFVASRLLEARPKPALWVPELHTVQPIANAAQSRQAKREVEITRGKGIDRGANLTVQGKRADAGQIALADRCLRIAASYNAPEGAMFAMMATLIVESWIRNLPGGEGTSSGPFQVTSSTASNFGISPRDVEACTRTFLKTGFTGQGGAIEHAKRGIDPARSAQMCQGSAYPSRYAQVMDEAREWVRAFGGGGTLSGSVTTTVEKRYAFEQGRDEDAWAMAERLMSEVRWRRFAANGVIYLIAETDLLASRIAIRVNDDSPGIDQISWTREGGRKVDEVTITGRAKAWAAPPGTVALVQGEGPADGRYIVSSIRSPLAVRAGQRRRRSVADIEVTLRRPQEPLPEPAPETTTKTDSFSIDLGAGGKGGAGKMIRWAQSQVGVQEGSSKQQQYANALGLSPSLPWCSIFLAYGLKQIGFKAGLPGNPAYSGAWLGWNGGERVGLGNIQPGDFAIFDWGDGGITDHVALYVGDGDVIGGNQSNAVTKVGLNRGAVVGVVRPKY